MLHEYLKNTEFLKTVCPHLKDFEGKFEELDMITALRGKTIVVKYGGNAMLNKTLQEQVMSDISFMQALGIKVVLVHGGGPEITSMLNRVGKKSEFMAGLRVTDKETMEIAEMVLVGKINTDLVGILGARNIKAMGLSGKDGRLMLAKKHLAEVYEAEQVKFVDVGYVGEIYQVNTELIEAIIAAGYIPVVAPIAMDESGASYNINADTAAGEIAGALAAEQLVLLTDTKGIYSDFGDEDSFMAQLTFEEAIQLMQRGKIDGGMIPKVKSCVTAITGGTQRTYIVDGREPHSVLRALFAKTGVGTEVVR